MVSAPRMYDLFLTHAWRYHDDWIKLSNALDAYKAIKWRNFSVPWYDPALDPNTELGARAIRAWIEGQIRPVRATILLDSVYAIKSARKWVELEVELSRAHGKRVFAIPAHGTTAISDDARALVDDVVGWNIQEFIAMLDSFSAQTQ